ncbi:MAG: hypothetical protein FJ319_10630 [SAR202 cluster bacterium]|nr:hypothetical protein [SAR202 cluster bacterium]
MNSDVINLSPAERVALRHKYNLVQWEVVNIPDKWVHLAASILPWNGNEESDREILDNYFGLGRDIDRVKADMNAQAARTGIDSLAGVAEYQAQLDDLKSKRNALRNEVEEIIESHISSAAREAGLDSRFGLVFPPTDIRLTDPPKVLIVSPRDGISRKYEVLLKADTSLEQSDAMEDRLKEDYNLSGLVVDIGGLATFPACVVNTMPLRQTLQVSAHEWLHHYIFFRPLGQNMFANGDMMTLNETFADMVGRELGDAAYLRLGGTIPQPVIEAPASTSTPAVSPVPAAFNYHKEMRATREQVDTLLAEGRYLEAETYMEERRQVFVARGYNIRKINQAFFAFFGTYAEGGESSSPIGSQLARLRMAIPDLQTFVKTMVGVKSYEEFEAILEIAESGTLAQATTPSGSPTPGAK